MNTESSNGLDVYILDTITQTGITKQYAFPKQILSIQVNANSKYWTGLSYHILNLNEKSELLSKKNGSLTGMRGPAKALVSAGKQYLLFYELSKTSNDSSQLRGVLLGAGWEVKNNCATVLNGMQN